MKIIQYKMFENGVVNTYRISGENMKIRAIAPYAAPEITFTDGQIEILCDGEFKPVAPAEGNWPENIVNEVLERVSRGEAATEKSHPGAKALVKVEDASDMFAALSKCFTCDENKIVVKVGKKGIPAQILYRGGYAVLVAATKDTLYYQDENLEGIMVNAKDGMIIAEIDGVVAGPFSLDKDEGNFIFEDPTARIKNIPIPVF